MAKEELIEKYGELELKFSSYYKYTFYYSVEKDGMKFVGGYGGSSDDIYRLEVVPNSVVILKDYEYELTNLYVTKDGETIFEYDNY